MQQPFRIGNLFLAEKVGKNKASHPAKNSGNSLTSWKSALKVVNGQSTDLFEALGA
jgi:hypothetical protein